MDNKKTMRTNAGYEIIKSIKLVNEDEYVLGFKITSYGEPEYVTWYFNNKVYYFGHYFMSKRHAYLDLIDRAIDALKCSKEMLIFES